MGERRDVGKWDYSIKVVVLVADKGNAAGTDNRDKYLFSVIYDKSRQ